MLPNHPGSFSSRIAPVGGLRPTVHPSAEILAPPLAVGYPFTSYSLIRGPAADLRRHLSRRIMARSKSPRSPFQDRRDAGRQLARALAAYAGRPDVVILALPRGGVPVASEVARALDAPLDVCLVRKLGVPGHEELAFGALATGGIRVLNEELVQRLGLPPRVIAAVTVAQRKELQRRRRTYRVQRRPPVLRGRIVILIDDGVATGASIRAALVGLRRSRPARIVLAVPVAAPEACAALRAEVDEVICGWTPEPFHAVGHWYADFAPTSDAEVRDLLEGSAPSNEGGAGPGGRSPRRS
jgi:predicted phosphoribosyltransferase